MTEPAVKSRVEQQVETVELAVGRFLRVGVVVASVLIAAGLAGLLFGAPEQTATRTIMAGLLVLVATPAMRVLAALAVYLREGDLVYALFSLFVLIMLSLGLLLGKMGG